MIFINSSDAADTFHSRFIVEHAAESIPGIGRIDDHALIS